MNTSGKDKSGIVSEDSRIRVWDILRLKLVLVPKHEHARGGLDVPT
jgi:hypothetical protein